MDGLQTKLNGGGNMSSCSSCGAQNSCASASKNGGNGHCSDAMQQQEIAIASNLASIKHKIFVMSGKGGVGKSSVTVNLATALAMHGKKVGILDVDIHGPSIPRMLGLSSSIEMDADGKMMLPAVYNDNLAVMSMDALLMDKDQAILWRGPKKTAAIRQFLSDVKWGTLDYLVIDSPPGTGDEHMTILQTIPDAECIAVTTPQEVSLADVRKALDFLHHTKATILGVVENMSGLICPHCRQEIDLFKKGGGIALANKYDIPFLQAIPLDPFTVVSADTGKPIVEMEGESPAKMAFLKLAEKVLLGG